MREGKSGSSLPLLVSPSNIVCPARLKLSACMEFGEKLLSNHIMTVYERKVIAAKHCTDKAELL